MRPHLVLHNAVSVDGRTDWIKPDLELFYGLCELFTEDATLVGSATLLDAPTSIDDSSDEIAEPGENSGRRPLLVAVDSMGRLNNWPLWQRSSYWSGCVSLASNATPHEHIEKLRALGVEVVVAGADKVDLGQALELLAERFGVRRIRVDSGGVLNGVLLREGLVDEVSLLIQPCLVGGSSPRSLFRAPDLQHIAGLLELELVHVQSLDRGHVWLRYSVRR